MPFRPSAETLDRYARILVDFALGAGKGISRGDVVLVSASDDAKPLYVAVRDAVIRSGGTVIGDYSPSGADRSALELASLEQLSTFHRAYYRGLAATIDHRVSILSTSDPRELDGVDPEKLLIGRRTVRPYRDWIARKEAEGRYTWTLALYGTPAMAKEAGLSFEAYWREIAAACFLDDADPIRRWRETFREISRIKRRLDGLEIERLHVEGDGRRHRLHGRRRPPLARRHRPEHPELRGLHHPERARHRGDRHLHRAAPPLREPDRRDPAHLRARPDRRGDGKAQRRAPSGDDRERRGRGTSRRDLAHRRPAEPDHAVHGRDALRREPRRAARATSISQLGNAYKEAFRGDIVAQTRRDWQRLGFNESSVHTDIVSTANRTATAVLQSGRSKLIYADGRFVI